MNLGLDGIAHPGEEPGIAISGWEPEHSIHGSNEEFQEDAKSQEVNSRPLMGWSLL